jgi:hypothetical protein
MTTRSQIVNAAIDHQILANIEAAPGDTANIETIKLMMSLKIPVFLCIGVNPDLCHENEIDKNLNDWRFEVLQVVKVNFGYQLQIKTSFDYYMWIDLELYTKGQLIYTQEFTAYDDEDMEYPGYCHHVVKFG